MVKNLEISKNSPNSIYRFEQEHNTIWLKLKVSIDGHLTFKLIPKNIKYDFDFLLFKIKNKKFCQEIRDKTLKPIRDKYVKE